MNEPDLLDDDGLERLVRGALADEAADAPRSGDLHGLADAAVSRGRAHRRRTAAAGTALSVVAVVAVVLAAGTLGGGRPGGAVPGRSSTPSPSQEATPPTSEDGVLLFRGVEVPVPAEMLDPSAYRCGTAVADAAYVRDDALPIESCAVRPAHPERLTEVVLQPVSTVPAAERVAGATRLPDGRTRVASALPRGDVWLSVTSPDPARADSLFEGALLPDRVSGCPIQPAPPQADPHGPLELFQTGTTTSGGVCGYRDNWLVGAALLDAGQVHQLTDLVQHAPSAATIDCVSARTAPDGTGWWVTLAEQRFYVDGARACPTFQVEGNDGERLVTSDLISALWSIAPGPASFQGVTSSK